MTPEQRAADLLRPETNVGLRLRRHCAPTLVEDLEQAVARAIREAVREKEVSDARQPRDLA